MMLLSCLLKGDTSQIPDKPNHTNTAKKKWPCSTSSASWRTQTCVACLIAQPPQLKVQPPQPPQSQLKKLLSAIAEDPPNTESVMEDADVCVMSNRPTTLPERPTSPTTPTTQSQLKKMLSANAEAPLNIECIMEDADVRGMLNRDQLEELVAPVLARVRAPIDRVRFGGKRGGEQNNQGSARVRLRSLPVLA